MIRVLDRIVIEVDLELLNIIVEDQSVESHITNDAVQEVIKG